MSKTIADSKMRGGILFVISAPSGAGKTTLCREVIKEFPDINLSVSCTTRDKRQGESDGTDYHFVDSYKFKEMVKEGAFAEWAKVHGELYGTTVETIEKARDHGRDLILDIDWQGAQQLKERIDDGIYIFILPPSMDELMRRLKKRGKDSEEIIKIRMNNAKEEIIHAGEYDYNVVNSDLEEAISTLKAIITAERCRPKLYR